jgi:hypothetical protein
MCPFQGWNSQMCFKGLNDTFFHYTTVRVTDLMVNMRERSKILYWFFDSKKNTKNSFETSFECSFKPLKHICEFHPWNGHIRHLHRLYFKINNRIFGVFLAIEEPVKDFRTFSHIYHQVCDSDCCIMKEGVRLMGELPYVYVIMEPKLYMNGHLKFL